MKEDNTNKPKSENPLQEINIRLNKLETLKENSIPPYADKYKRSHSISEASTLPLGTEVKIAGRIVLLRNMGKMTFARIFDITGQIQIFLRIDDLDEKEYKLFLKIISLGDFVGVEGEIYKTQKGEISVLVKKYTFLSKSLRPLPEKWHGLTDKEIKYRKRYLDLISNEETRERFKFRSKFIHELRNYYYENGFYELPNGS